MISSLTIKKGLFSPNWRCRYEFRATLTPQALPILVDAVAQQLLPIEAISGGSVHDIKGVERGYWAGEESQKELLFRARGAFFDNADDSQLVVTNPFELSVTSSFESFVGHGHISHRLHLEERGDITRHLPIQVAVRNVGRIFPAQVHQMQFGMEFFESRRYFVFGISPAAVERVMLEVDGSSCALAITSESLPTRDTLPLRRGIFFESIARIIEQATALDPLADYRSKLFQ